MSKPSDGSKYLANVKPRSGKHPRIVRYSVYGGDTGMGWHSYKEKPSTLHSEDE